MSGDKSYADGFTIQHNPVPVKPARRIPFGEEPAPEKPKQKGSRYGGSIASTTHKLTIDAEEKKPWRTSDGKLDDDRVVAYKVPCDGSTMISHKWVITESMDIINKMSGEDLIWAGSKDELLLEVRARNPAPDGFTFVSYPFKGADEISVHSFLVQDRSEPPTPNEIMAAAAAGHDLSHTKFCGDSLMQSCGYSAEEVDYLTNRSRLDTIPLKGGLVLRWKGRGYGYRDYVVELDEDDYRASLKSLKHSRKNRKKSKKGKILNPTQIVTSNDIRRFSHDLFHDIRRRTKMPSEYIVRYDGLGSLKGCAAGIVVSQMVPWYLHVAGHDYRKLASYKSMIKTWADTRNRAKTIKVSELNMKDNLDLKPMQEFMEWLDEELAYCRKRGWKFARDPENDAPKKKRK
jgi:hypothetical protein